jgi:hypothetical protein
MNKQELFEIIDRRTLAKGRRAARETWVVMVLGLLLVVGGGALFILAITGTWPH